MSPIQQIHFNELKNVSSIEQNGLIKKGLNDGIYDIEYIRKQAVDNKETQLVKTIDNILLEIVKNTILSPCEELKGPILGLDIKRVTVKNSYKNYTNLKSAIQNYYYCLGIDVPKEKINLLKLNKLVRHIHEVMKSLKCFCKKIQIDNSVFKNLNPNIPDKYKQIIPEGYKKENMPDGYEIKIPDRYEEINRYFKEFILIHRDHILHLDLEYKQLKVLHPNICSLNSITNLNVANNKLKELPINLYDLNFLTFFNISHNFIKTLSRDIYKLQFIKNLDVSYNQLTSLPNEIVQLTNLSCLDVSHNQLTSLPNEIGNLTNLYQLYASDNAIHSLPDSLVKLSNLFSLRISNNKVKVLPKDFHKLKKLQILDLEKNQFSTLPKVLKNSKLQILDLQNNPLKFIFDEIKLDYQNNFFFRELKWMKKFNEQFHQKLQSPLAKLYHATLIEQDTNTFTNYFNQLSFETKSDFEKKLKEYKSKYLHFTPILTNLGALKFLILERYNFLSDQNKVIVDNFIKQITGSQLNIEQDNIALLAEAVENIDKLSEDLYNDSMIIDSEDEYQYSSPLIQNLFILQQHNILDENKTIQLLQATIKEFPQIENTLNIKNENLINEYPNILKEMLIGLQTLIVTRFNQEKFIEQYLIKNQINNLLNDDFAIETIEDLFNLEDNVKFKIYDIILSQLNLIKNNS